MAAITDQRIATRAHQAVAKAIAVGELHQQPCEVCNDPKTIAHHDDYGKPLAVRWLCASHHRKWHVDHPSGISWMTKPGYRAVKIYIPEEDALALEGLAREQDRSIPYLARKAIGAYLHERREGMKTK